LSRCLWRGFGQNVLTSHPGFQELAAKATLFGFGLDGLATEWTILGFGCHISSSDSRGLSKRRFTRKARAKNAKGR
jgi:hypothetical protein